LLLPVLRNLLCVRFGALVLDAGLAFVFEFLRLRTLTVLDESGGTLSLFSYVFVTSRDAERVVVRPLDVDILLFDARELAMEFVRVWCLLDIEFWREGADGFEGRVEITEGVALVFVEEAEHGRQLLGEAWEKRHCGVG
jgi:hypothetical protein